jgi:deferrochelatase/peroxidase EfeB
MPQASGVLPYGDAAVMKEPSADGYLVGVTLQPDLGSAGLRALLETATGYVDELLAVVTSEGKRVATAAIGLSPQLFTTIAPDLPRPAGFVELPIVPGDPVPWHLLFYVMSTFEAPVATFLSSMWGLQPAVVSVSIERGYQRLDRTEAFGNPDGLRNIEHDDRFAVAFIHADNQPEEPEQLVGGSYIAYLKIGQNLANWEALEPDAQAKIVGRDRAGDRADHPGAEPRHEPEMPRSEPPAVTSHVRKAGPRGVHDDTSIFRRGLPFFEMTDNGTRLGLQFVSFQASLDQFDVLFNDWMMNPAFPSHADFGVEVEGPDALLIEAGGLVTFERSGFFFCPPASGFLGGTLFDPPAEHRRPSQGRVDVRKRVIDPADPQARFERGGFRFRLLDADSESLGVVSDWFETNSQGHGTSPEVATGHRYILEEEVKPGPPVTNPAEPFQPFELDRAHLVIKVVNTVSTAGGYGSR